MKNIIIAFSLLLLIDLSSCSKKDAAKIETSTARTTDAISVTGKWNAGLQTDIVNGQDPSVAGSTRTSPITLNNWEFRESGMLTIGNGSTTQSISFKLLPENKIILTINSISDTMNMVKAGENKILLEETRKLRNGTTLKESLELYRLMH